MFSRLKRKPDSNGNRPADTRDPYLRKIDYEIEGIERRQKSRELGKLQQEIEQLRNRKPQRNHSSSARHKVVKMERFNPFEEMFGVGERAKPQRTTISVNGKRITISEPKKQAQTFGPSDFGASSLNGDMMNIGSAYPKRYSSSPYYRRTRNNEPLDSGLSSIGSDIF